MNWLKEFIIRLLKIKPAVNRRITISEPLTFQENVLKNQLWYRGNPEELEQFFKQTAFYDVDKARFWASVPFGRVRKIHSGIVGIVVDRFRDIVVADMDGVEFEDDGKRDIWDEIVKDCHFNDVIGEGISGTLSSGDGAFKVSIDEKGLYPVVEFYQADRICFERTGQKLKEIKFYTPYKQGNKEYQLEETYGIGYVRYKLYSETGKEVSLDTLEELRNLSDAEFDGGFIMAVPFIIFHSNQWKGRGKALFDAKTDNLDALDEVISQWLDAVRMGRVKRYIPEDMVPRDPDTGRLMEANPFDNDYIAVGAIKAEGETGKIDISQPQISYEAYVNSYASFLDLVLQGIISPATLGIDLKKTDNGEAQREKEKITMHTRNKIVETMDTVVPELANTIMKVYDLMHHHQPCEYEASVKFGEYASPDFDSTVETVVKAKSGGVMSIEKSVDELYGDTLTPQEKEEEIARLKAEQGIVEMEESGVNLEGLEEGTKITTLNGAQIASLMNVIKMVKEGEVSREEAISIIVSTLGISREAAETFIREEAKNEGQSSKQNISNAKKAVQAVIGDSGE